MDVKFGSHRQQRRGRIKLPKVGVSRTEFDRMRGALADKGFKCITGWDRYKAEREAKRRVSFSTFDLGGCELVRLLDNSRVRVIVTTDPERISEKLRNAKMGASPLIGDEKSERRFISEIIGLSPDLTVEVEGFHVSVQVSQVETNLHAALPLVYPGKMHVAGQDDSELGGVYVATLGFDSKEEFEGAEQITIMSEQLTMMLSNLAKNSELLNLSGMLLRGQRKANASSDPLVTFPSTVRKKIRAKMGESTASFESPEDKIRQEMSLNLAIGTYVADKD